MMLIWCGAYGLQEEFFDCLCSIIDTSSDADDSLVDAAKSVVLNGQFQLAVFSVCFVYICLS